VSAWRTLLHFVFGCRSIDHITTNVAALAGTLSRLRRTHAPGKMMTREYSLDPLVLGKPLFAWESRKLEVTTRETTTKGLPW